ncbi:MAG: hypothetical protein ACYC6T_08215 [Thermoleophilia bacterium]
MMNKDAKFDMPCPNCGQQIPATLGELERDDDIRCPGCNLRVTNGPEVIKEFEEKWTDLVRRMKRP